MLQILKEGTHVRWFLPFPWHFSKSSSLVCRRNQDESSGILKWLGFGGQHGQGTRNKGITEMNPQELRGNSPWDFSGVLSYMCARKDSKRPIGEQLLQCWKLDKDFQSHRQCLGEGRYLAQPERRGFGEYFMLRSQKDHELEENIFNILE